MKKIAHAFPFCIVAFLLCLLGLWIALRYPLPVPESSEISFAKNKLKIPHQTNIKIHSFVTASSKIPEAILQHQGALLTMQEIPHPVIWIEHPRGNFLIDGGIGKTFSEERTKAPFWIRFFQQVKLLHPWIEQKEIPPEDKIQFALLTHGHWDHGSGLLDLPQVPIRMLPEEIKWLEAHANSYSDGISPTQVKNMKGRWEALLLEDKPYENFSKSLDLFGDGTVVIVALPGHTPGSMGIFINQAPDRRFLFVGDATYGTNTEGWPLQRSRIMEALSDQDIPQARKTRKQLETLVQQHNEITLIPTHDIQSLKKLQES